MAFYEHTFVGKPNLSANELKALTDKYSDFINSSGKILKTEQAIFIIFILMGKL